MSVSYVERDGKRFALVPEDVYQRMLDDIDDLYDIRAYDAAKAKPQELIPAIIVDRLIDGENPLRVWREYRGYTGATLAEQVGITAAYLSQLEHGHRLASHLVLRKLATALKVDVDDLIKRDGGIDQEGPPQ